MINIKIKRVQIPTHSILLDLETLKERVLKHDTVSGEFFDEYIELLKIKYSLDLQINKTNCSICINIIELLEKEFLKFDDKILFINILCEEVKLINHFGLRELFSKKSLINQMRLIQVQVLDEESSNETNIKSIIKYINNPSIQTYIFLSQTEIFSDLIKFVKLNNEYGFIKVTTVVENYINNLGEIKNE